MEFDAKSRIECATEIYLAVWCVWPCLLIGGYAFSIYENNESIALPIIVPIALVMAYVALYDETDSRLRKRWGRER